MPLIERLEDIRAWQEARTLVKMVYEVTRQGDFAKDFGLRDQIQRAAVSVMTNIAEGFDCETKKEFSRFLGYSSRSALEIKSLLYVALDVGYIDHAAFDRLVAQVEKTKSLVGALRHSLSRNRRPPTSKS